MGCCCSAKAIDPNEAIAAVREEAPEVLVENEEFHYAFAFTRDQVYLTNVRILIKDKQGFTGSSVSWKTIPYSSIKAFYIETAGNLDLDVEMGFWPSGISQGEFDRYKPQPSQAIEIKFKKSGGVDLYALQRLMNQKIFCPEDSKPIEVAPQPEGMDTDGKFSKFVDLLGGDARAIDPKMMEEQLRVDPPILLPEEVVDMAFKCGRDTTCLTSKRVLRIDVKGISGKRVRYQSLLWPCMKAFEVATPGYMIDRDCELTIWTSISHCDENKFKMDIRSASCDILAIQRYFADKILGQDEDPPSDQAVNNAGQEDTGGGWQAWLAGDSRQIDAVEANRKFHEDVHILQGSETCEMAFKAARDMMLFTTKRLIRIDPQGITGKKVSYTSLPWKCIQAFGLQSPGAWLDKDSEMLIWTDIFHDFHTESEEQGSGDDSNEVTIYIADPGLSHFSVDFQKDKVDLPAIGRYIASRCAKLGSQTSMPSKPMQSGLLKPSDPGMMEKFLGWLTSDYKQVDPDEMDQKLHGDCSMLLPDEKVQMAFCCGRDTAILTTHRAMKIDKQGFTGTKVLYLSLPYTKLKAYEVESAGSWDLDSKMTLTIKAPWYNKEVGPGLNIEFGKGRCDIIALSKYISAQVIGNADGTSTVVRQMLPPQPEGMVGNFMSWLGDDYKQISKEEALQKFTSDPPIMLEDETIDLAFKCGRDFILFTTKRYMRIDTQGWSGQRVAYQSLPFKSLMCFLVTGAASHPFDQDAEIQLFTDAGTRSIDVKKNQGDIMAVYTFLNKKCMMDKVTGV